ncbi:aspartyl protease [Anaerobacterium chartisolvens]|uniref:Aspartyl protease n=1 Tax=Anaerobacterium chartisolvens TaxID=1297424 RepID=A0A369AX61_9FIRM|nr:retropepsin-like aspartic protease [Anaerobacterium chartisolvens]RCX13879.1 aspartyl protease [Anaerobacterium chartisolvens]
MQNLQFKNGLLYTSVRLIHNGKEVIVNDVIVDTGASHTIILSDYLLDLDVGFLDTDELVKSSGYGGIVFSAVRKKLDRVCLEGVCLEHIKVDFGEIDPYERVNGLIGLDFLMRSKVVIDLEGLTISN